MSFNLILQTMGVEDTLRVITYLDNFNKIVTYFFDGVALKLALLSGIVNVLKYIITVDEKHQVSRLKVLSEALFVSIIMYATTFVLISNDYPIYTRYLVAIAIGFSGYSMLEKVIKLLVTNFIQRFTTNNGVTNNSSDIDKKNK